MNFSAVYGHSQIKKDLISSVSNGRMAHAQLFIAKKGVGALNLALAYATYLLCENPGEENACGHCSSCRKNDKLVHPDLHFSYPTTGKSVSTDHIKEWRAIILEKGYFGLDDWLNSIGDDNKLGNLSKDECKSIISRLSLRATQGGAKVMIIWLPEFLGKEGNRLLKTIEEPRGNTYFLFVTEAPDKIIQTILSRCQLINLAPLDDDSMYRYAEANMDIGADSLRSAIFMAEGSITTLHDVAQESNKWMASIFIDWLRVCFRGKPKEMVEWVESINTGRSKRASYYFKMGRKDLKVFLQYSLFFFNELIYLLMDQNDRSRLQGEVLETAQKMGSVFSIEDIVQIAPFIEKMIYHVERNGHPKILFLNASIRMHRLMRYGDSL